ncbi:MAG TPA: hypothetical protein VMU39_07440 [Solirubrobacteraceae bacterium]|nr:hypothetical protein [Solirubrobacteraceae bacterium]
MSTHAFTDTAAPPGLLAGHEPYPAIAVDRGWNLVASNSALGPLIDGVSRKLLQPPVNCMRLSLHPDGLAPRILNLGEWRTHLLHRLERQIGLTGNELLRELYDELASYPGARAPARDAAGGSGSGAGTEIMAGLRLATEDGDELSFFSAVTTFGTAVDITVSELSIEAFFPADARTAERLSPLAAVT